MTLARAQKAGFWVLAAIVVYLATPRLNKDVEFYDEGIYLAAGKAIALGKGYVDLRLPSLPPQITYPPFLPLLLSVFWRFNPQFPDNLLVIRLIMLLCGLAFLAASYNYLIRNMHFKWPEALAITALVGVNNLFLNFTTSAVSEIPYALLAVGSLYWYQRFLASNRRLYLGFSLGFAGLAFFTRIIGAALFCAFALHSVFARRRRLLPIVGVSGLIFFLPWQAWVLNGQSAYQAYPPEIALNYRDYLTYWALGNPWDARLFQIVWKNAWNLVYNWSVFIFPWSALAMSGLLVAVLCKWILSARKTTGSTGLYCLIFSLATLFWPWPLNDRFVLVISPFLLGFFFLGLRLFLPAENTPGRVKTELICSWVAVILAVGSVSHAFISRYNYQQTRQAIAPQQAAFRRLSNWIVLNTPSDAVLIGNFDPMYYLYAGRKAVSLPHFDWFSTYYAKPLGAVQPDVATRLLTWYKRHKACYLVEETVSPAWERHYYFRGLIQGFNLADSASVARVYQDPAGMFNVYGIAQCG